MRKLWDAKEAASRALVEKAGSQVIAVDKKPFQDAMKPVYDKFITDPKLKDLIRRVQETQ
jgi:TRAP-type C4-dicarboxylate transport system substrate-binding protein